MNSKNPMPGLVDGQYAKRGLRGTSLCIAAVLLVFAVHTTADAEEVIETESVESARIDFVGEFASWKMQPDSSLAEMYGQGAKIVSPEANSELAIILWDEVRNNERRPVRSVSDDGNGNIQVNEFRMQSR